MSTLFSLTTSTCIVFLLFPQTLNLHLSKTLIFTAFLNLLTAYPLIHTFFKILSTPFLPAKSVLTQNLHFFPFSISSLEPFKKPLK